MSSTRKKTRDVGRRRTPSWMPAGGVIDAMWNPSALAVQRPAEQRAVEAAARARRREPAGSCSRCRRSAGRARPPPARRRSRSASARTSGGRTGRGSRRRARRSSRAIGRNGVAPRSTASAYVASESGTYTWIATVLPPSVSGLRWSSSGNSPASMITRVADAQLGVADAAVGHHDRVAEQLRRRTPRCTTRSRRRGRASRDRA